MKFHFALHVSHQPSASLHFKLINTKLLSCFSLLSLCLASPRIFANQGFPNPVLQEQQVVSTVVSEDLTQPSAQTFAQSIRSIPGGVSVVESKAFDTKRVSTFADSLGYATGVFIQPRFGSEESRLSIRGSGLQRTFHGRGTRLMQDGIPINLADGGFDFQAIEPLASQYVQVYRGANAFGLGASTLGGAIDYISETGRTASPFGVRMEVGSFAYHRATAHIAKQEENWDGYFFVSDHRQEGFREYARQDGNKWVGNLGLKLNEQLATRFYVGGARSNSQLPGNLSLAQIAQNASQANAVSRAGAYRRDVNLDRLANKTVYQYAGGSVEVNVYASLKDLFHPIFQVIDQNSKDWGGRLSGIPNISLWARHPIRALVWVIQRALPII